MFESMSARAVTAALIAPLLTKEIIREALAAELPTTLPTATTDIDFSGSGLHGTIPTGEDDNDRLCLV